MSDERRDLTPDELGAAIDKLLACIWSEPDLAAWGKRHAPGFDAIAATHPQHHRAARAAYARRLQALRAKT